MLKATPTIAATSTLAMVRTAEERGVATADLLAEAGLSIAFLEDPDARIAAPVVLALWNALRERSNDPALQLYAPTTLPFGAYRVIDYLCAASSTVAECVGRFARFFSLIAPAVVVRVDQDGPWHCMSLAREDGGPVPPIYVDYVFAAFVRRVRARIRRELRPSRIEFRQPAPPESDVYETVFEAPVLFGTPHDRICFDQEEWDAEIDTADAMLARVLEEHAEILTRRAPKANENFVREVERAIAAAPPEGGSIGDIARALNMSARTLQRKLIELGTTFRTVAEGVRGQLAQEYLDDPKVGIAEVAFMLGFSDQSSFNRAFRRWTGMSPGRWRRRLP
ncbi:MAG: AraC family transcriptional regulator ligand-binding domain-containing protein [Candidatus Eisenbacteria bacterium]